MQQSRSEVFRSVLVNRKSVRQFKKKPLHPNHLRALLEAAIHAPSGSNSQNQRFLVIEDDEEKSALGSIRFVWPYPNADKMREIKPAGLIGGAAAVIVVFADAAMNDHRDNGEYYIWESIEIQNCAASIENMLNMATALGIGSCWLSASENMSGTRLLNKLTWATALAKYAIPSWYKIQGIIIFGYPRGELDNNGFPKGEKEHGASIWASTTRKEIEHYLIKRRDPTENHHTQLSKLQNIQLYILSKTSRFLLRLIRYVDKLIYYIEVKKALINIYNKK